MGNREKKLKNVLIKEFGNGAHPKPSKAEYYNSKFNSEIENIYRKLGGTLSYFPTSFRGYDIQCRKFIVELDEERHFNRYRLITLHSDFYSNNKINFQIDKYKTLCKKKEGACLKAAGWRKNWENKSTSKQFGISDNPGCLGQRGSSRWKQRAFYDYLRDIAAHIIQIPIIRISIWEIINEVTVDNLIEMNKFYQISELIHERACY